MTTSAQLAADLSTLLGLGQLALPDLANTFATLNVEVSGTRGQDGVSFTPCPSTAGVVDLVKAPWTAIRDRLQDYLGDGAQNFETAGRAIVAIVNEYEATDADAAASVRSVWSNGVPAYLGHNKTPEPMPQPPNVVIV